MVTPVQKAILRHIARYQVSLRPVIDRKFFNGKSGGCGKAIADLKTQKLIESKEHGIADAKNSKANFTLYHLSLSATRLVGATARRANAPGPTAIPRSLAILWYCCMRKTPSYRLEAREVKQVFLPGVGGSTRKDGKIPGFHCLSPGPEFHISNVSVPKASLAETVSELKKNVRNAREIPELAEAIALKRYRYLVLVESSEMCDQLRVALSQTIGQQGVAFFVTRAPGSWGVSSGEVGLRGRRSRQDSKA
ncbi:hypothetical protein [Lacipirellula parvula]|uniref:hypothetical protein n=1 Tax=Lacipirellula parvula TaxID=2650471 RepID=UPI00126061E9|nr:hypothetical protein [Lacipirellula parvula]